MIQDMLRKYRNKIDPAVSALTLRMRAFIKMDNTRIYKDKRFRFLGVSLAVVTAMILTLPKNHEAQASAKIDVAAPVVPLIDLTRHDLYLEETRSPRISKSADPEIWR